MDNQQERLMRLAYVAGLIAGEGWFGITVLRRERKLQLVPRFAIQMNDKATILWAADVFKEYGFPHHVTKTQDRIEIVGLKRLARFLPGIVPLLTGHKQAVAKVVQEWVEYRLTQPYHFVNYTEHDIDLVNRIRTMNAGNGKDKLIPVSILRDYTLSTRPKAKKI